MGEGIEKHLQVFTNLSYPFCCQFIMLGNLNQDWYLNAN